MKVPLLLLAEKAGERAVGAGVPGVLLSLRLFEGRWCSVELVEVSAAAVFVRTGSCGKAVQDLCFVRAGRLFCKV